MEKGPNMNKSSALEIVKSMSEAETFAFLKKHGVVPFDDETWQPHEPLLYVFEDAFRGDDGPYKHLPQFLRPSIARIDDPSSIDFDRPHMQMNRVTYKLSNQGRVDFYAIDPKTEKPILVRSTNNKKGYDVRQEALFQAKDSLFPKGMGDNFE